MSVYENPDFKQLVEIRESVFSLLDRKINGVFSKATSSNLNRAIRSRTRALKANPLYGTSGNELQLELGVLDLSVSRVIHFFGCDDDRRVLEIITANLRGHFDVWFKKLQDEAVLCGVVLRGC